MSVAIAPETAKYTAEIAIEARTDLGESPIYDQRTECLYFVDINGKTIHSFNVKTNDHQKIALDEPIGCIALTTSPDHLLAACRRNIYLVALKNPTQPIVKTLATAPQEPEDDQRRFNDGKVSPQGAFIVGRMHNKWRENNHGMLYSLDPGALELREIMSYDSVGLPNGLGWNTQGTECVFVDSARETVTLYKTDAVGAPLANEVVRVISERKTDHKHVPDGMTLDTDGNVWVAVGESSSIQCYHSQTGELLHTISLPVQRPTSCVFGGNELRDLYVTSRVEKVEEGGSEHWGAMVRVRIDGIQGMGTDAGLFKINDPV